MEPGGAQPPNGRPLTPWSRVIRGAVTTPLYLGGPCADEFASYTPPPKLARALAAGIARRHQRHLAPELQRVRRNAASWRAGLPAPGERLLQPFGWGLIPPWAKDPRIGSKAFNARAETVADKPMYRSAFRKHRALVPVDGFYEWQRNEHRGKQPYYFTRADCQLAVFAGLWEYWERAGQSLWTCTIITTDANPDMESIHNRMPVVLEHGRVVGLAGPHDLARASARAPSLVPAAGRNAHQAPSPPRGRLGTQRRAPATRRDRGVNQRATTITAQHFSS